MAGSVPIEIAAQWGRLNDTIVDLVDYVPTDKIEWSPRPDLFNFRGIFAHIAIARRNWLGYTVQDGEPFDIMDVLSNVGSPDAIRQVLHESWGRVGRFLQNREALEATYGDEWNGETREISGHWIAFHLLEHDIHHRADIFHYLALLEIEHPEIGTP